MGLLNVDGPVPRMYWVYQAEVRTRGTDATGNEVVRPEWLCGSLGPSAEVDAENSSSGTGSAALCSVWYGWISGDCSNTESIHGQSATTASSLRVALTSAFSRIHTWSKQHVHPTLGRLSLYHLSRHSDQEIQTPGYSPVMVSCGGG